ncbi:MAG: hypothetical protein ABIT08_08460 [Bacteroidia bacterium]
MNTQELLFEEKQYLGYNKLGLVRNLVLVLFCFVAYYYTENREQSGDLFFVLGVSILVLSIIFLFVKHIHTKVYPGSIVLDGIWTTRKVKIDLGSITKAEQVPYSKYHLNNPVYNLHIKGVVRFYTMGKEAVRLTDKDGLVYLIGSQKADEMHRIISSQINSP